MESEEILDITEEKPGTDDGASQEESVSKALGKPLIFTATFVVLVVIVVGMIIVASPNSPQEEVESFLTEEEVAAYRAKILQDVEVVMVSSNTVRDYSDTAPIAPLSESELAALERDNYASVPTAVPPIPPAVEEMEEGEEQATANGVIEPVTEGVVAPLTDEEVEALLLQQGVDSPGATQEGVHSTTGNVDGAIVNPYVINGLQEVTITGTVLSVVETEGYFILRAADTGKTHSVVIDSQTRFTVGGKQTSFAALSSTDSVAVEGEMYKGDTILYADTVTITGTQEVIFVSP